MLRITRVTVGRAGVEYLLRQAGCASGHERAASDPQREGAAGGVERGSTDYYTGAVRNGEPAGRWLGSGLSDLGFEAGAMADPETVRAVFGDLVDPQTGEAIGRRPRQNKSVEQRLEQALKREPYATPERAEALRLELLQGGSGQAVGFFDLTFSAPKSVSVYYAALLAEGRTEAAEQVWQAHQAAAASALAYMEREAGYSRKGYHGRSKSDGGSVGEWTAARRWIAIRWDHTVNRENEPQLHSHVQLLNRTRCEDDNVWRTLDSRALYKQKDAAAAIYERGLEEELSERNGVRFALREDGKAREIVGISQAERDAYSTRRTQVLELRDQWAAEYREKHGKEPSAYELTLMAERAALATRRAKETEPMSPDERNSSWQQKYEERFGRTVNGRGSDVDGRAAEAAVLSADERAEVCKAAVALVQAEKSQWNRANLMMAVHKLVEGRFGTTAAGSEDLLVGLADEALSTEGVVLLTAPELVDMPEALRREQDGRSRWRPHEDERYATEGQLVAEERLVGVAKQTGARRLDEEQLEQLRAELEATDENGRTRLGDAQRAAVLGVLGSGRYGDVLLGPAGTGKSTTVGEMTAAWEKYTGGRVVGLATSQIAANVLHDEGLANTYNITKFLGEYEHAPGKGTAQHWLPANTLIVVDESGMSSTDQLARVQAVAKSYGAKILFTGDTEQLDSPAAGGAFRLLTDELGDEAYRLEEVRRFANEWERDASLQLREGDREAVRAYRDRGRIVHGTREEMTSAAVRNYLADTLDGKKSLLITATNERAADLSSRVRDQLVSLGRVDDERTVDLPDGTRCGRGDLVQTRQNDRRTMSRDGRWVVNRDMWRVLKVDPDGGLHVELVQSDPEARPCDVTLTPAYVEQHAVLGYAGTVHSAQGLTVDTSHPLADVSTSRQNLYVGMTRGREKNTLYLVTGEDPGVEETAPGLRADPDHMLVDILDNDQAQRSAVQVVRDELTESQSLASRGPVWQEIVKEQCEHRYADMLLHRLGPERLDDIQDDPGAGRLWRAMREAELTGHNVEEVADEITRGSFEGLRSLADGLRGRLGRATREAPAEPPIRFVDRTPVGEDVWAKTAREYAELMDARADELARAAVENPPQWAVDHLGPVPDDPIDREQWAARVRPALVFREFAGRDEQPVALGPAPSHEMPEMRATWETAYKALGAPEEERDFYASTDGELERIVGAYERAEAWAPPEVSAQLAENARNLARFETDATLYRATAEAETDPDAREHAETRAEGRERIAEQLRGYVQSLEEIHEARGLWHEHTEPERHAAELARRELGRRFGLDEETHEPELEQPEVEPEVAPEPVVDEPRQAQAEAQQAHEGPQSEVVEAENGLDEGDELRRPVDAVESRSDLDLALAHARGVRARIEAEQERAVVEDAERTLEISDREAVREVEPAHSLEQSGPELSL